MSFFEEYIYALRNKNIPYKILNQEESNAVFAMLEKISYYGLVTN